VPVGFDGDAVIARIVRVVVDVIATVRALRSPQWRHQLIDSAAIQREIDRDDRDDDELSDALVMQKVLRSAFAGRERGWFAEGSLEA
jgi:hypothetical protein